MKFGTSNSDEEINKILNEFYNPESRNKNNNNELIKSWKIKLKSKSKLWNLLESRLSDWITLKDDDFSVYEVTETVDYLLDIKNWK